jgi:septal ring factor EnvC (AmiA/AmiB activator)
VLTGNEQRLSARLCRLPGQLLLALVNGTAVLLIVAAVLVLVAAARIDHLAANVAATMTDAVLTRLDTEPQQLRAELRSFGGKVSELTAALKSAAADGSPVVGGQIADLKEQVAALRTSIEQLDGAKSRLIDETVAAFGRSVAGGLEQWRWCPPLTGDEPS